MQVPAQALEPNGTNPLGLDPMFLAAAYYGSMAWESEMAEEGYTDPNSEPGCNHSAHWRKLGLHLASSC